MTAEIATVEQAIRPIKRSLMRLPKRPRTAAPASGARMMTASKASLCAPFIALSSSLESQRVRFVNVERFAIAEDRDDDRQADGSFGGGDRHHDEDEQLAADVAEVARHRHQRQVDGVQHQLDPEEDGDGVALDEDADRADCE